MIVSILQENLLHALTKTGRNLSNKPQLPILQNVLLKTEEGRLVFITTNLETTEIVRSGAKVEKDGEICVSSRLLTELAVSLPQETVLLSVADGSLVISCSGTTATIPGVPGSEFPPLPKQAKGERLSLDKEKLAGALGSVLFSAATDEGRPLLTGIKIVSDDNEVTLAATDGYRLSVKKLDLPLKHKLDRVVPARALAEVVKTGGEEKEAKSVLFSETEDGQLWFTIGDTEIITRKIDGEYPDFKKIVPTKFSTRVVFEKEDLLRAAKSVAIFARDNANIIRIHIENQTVIVSANTPSVGENKVDIGTKVDGDGGDIAFNSRFLLELLNNFSGEELIFEMTGSLNPGVFRPVKDESYFHIIMPVRTSTS